MTAYFKKPKLLLMATASFALGAVFFGSASLAQNTLPQPNVPVNMPAPDAEENSGAPVSAEASQDDENVQAAPPTEVQAQQEITRLASVRSPQDSGVKPSDIDSPFFTFWEHAAIIDAKNSVDDFKRGVTEDELDRALRDSDQLEERPKPPPEEREITLGGIVFTSQNDWTIWLNGERIEPDALPKEIIGLKVHENYIEMKWLDDWTMQVYPLRLRPHQRFNLDTRIFLPG